MLPAPGWSGLTHDTPALVSQWQAHLNLVFLAQSPILGEAAFLLFSLKPRETTVVLGSLIFCDSTNLPAATKGPGSGCHQVRALYSPLQGSTASEDETIKHSSVQALRPGGLLKPLLTEPKGIQARF